MWADGQTDLTKLIIAFRNFLKAQKKNWNSTYDDIISKAG